MAQETGNFYRGLRRLFSNNVIVRYVGKKKVKVIDTDGFQMRHGDNPGKYSRMKTHSKVEESSAEMQGSIGKNLLYDDYMQMDKDSILSSALDLYAEECLAGETLIPLLSGEKISIEELYNNNLKDFWVYGLDDNNFIPVKCERVANNGVKQMYKIKLNDGTEIKATSNHMWVLFNGSLLKTKNLKIGEKLKTNTTDECQVISIEKSETEMAYDLVNTGDSHIYALETLSGRLLYTHNCTTKDEFEDVLTITTDNKNIEDILQNLFYDILNIPFNLWGWIRNMCKFGDCYLYLELHKNLGIVNVKILSPYDVERLEGVDEENPYLVQFIVGGDKSGMLEEFQVAHFRLLGDVFHYPYGRSMLEGARLVWKQIKLMEDAMMIHRITRAPEKRIIKVDVGALPPDEIDEHMENIINGMRRTPFIDPQTGEYNLKYNLMPVRKDTKIPLLDGRTLTIEELAKEYNIGKRNYVYAVDRGDNGKIKSGEVLWCGLTKPDSKLVRIILDDDSYVDFEPNHPIMLRDGTYKAAKDIIKNDSLMPFRTIKSDDKRIKNYEKVFDPKTQEYKFTHRNVSDQYNINDYKNNSNVVHHKDFNKLNNSPENLDCSMTFFEHIKYHTQNASNIWKGKSQEEKNKNNLHEMVINHKVKEVKWLDETDDTYCMNVKTYHNFAIDSHNGKERDGFFVKNSINEDFFFPVRGGDTGTEIDTLSGMEYAVIDDIEYLQRKQFAALRIPKAFLSYEDEIGSKATLSAEDLRFARTIERIQKIVISELTKLAIIHLYAQGYKNKDLLDFELSLSNPSVIHEEMKVELWNSKVSLARDMMDTNLLSSDFVYEQIFKLSEDDALKERNGVVEDKKRMFRYEQIEQEGTDPANPTPNKDDNGDDDSEFSWEESNDDYDVDDDYENKKPNKKSKINTLLGVDDMKDSGKPDKNGLKHTYKGGSALSLEGIDLDVFEDVDEELERLKIIKEKRIRDKWKFLDRLDTILRYAKDETDKTLIHEILKEEKDKIL
jgi:hypothetical protein